MAARDPHELGPEDLVLSHFSLRYAGVEERIEAAAAGGFAGIGLYTQAYEELRHDGWTDADLRAVCAANGVCIAEIEAIRPWSARALAETTATAFAMADAFGCRYLQCIGSHNGSVADAAHRFADLCDAGARHGLNVGIEFLPFTDIGSAADALAIVEQADRRNAGICVDAWHVHRGGRAGLDRIPGERIMAIQMNDGPIVPEDRDYYNDCLTNRRLPGDGEFDLTGLIAQLRTAGATAPWAVEVISTALQQLAAHDAARQMGESTRRALRSQHDAKGIRPAGRPKEDRD